MTELQKTIKIKLRPTLEQKQILEDLITNFTAASNHVIRRIAKIQKQFKRIDKQEGKCTRCKQNKNLFWQNRQGKCCYSCYNKAFSKYTLQKSVHDPKFGLHKAAKFKYKTYYTNAVRFASDTMKSFETIRQRKDFRQKRMKQRLVEWKSLLTDPAKRREKQFPRVVKYAFADDRRENPRYYSEADIKRRIARLEKVLKKSKPPSYPEFKRPTMSLQRELVSFTPEKGFRITGVTAGKDEFIDYFGKDYLKDFYDDITRGKKPVVLVKKEGDDLYVCYPITKTVQIAEPTKSCEPVGIDWGLRHIAVASILDPNTMRPKPVRFFRGGYIYEKRKHFQNLRKSFGIRKRLDKITQLGQRERKFIDRQCHNIARDIVNWVKENSTNPVIVMEDIEDSREETESKWMRKRLMHSVRSKLQAYIKYTAEWEGIPFRLLPSELVKYSSQACHICGHEDRNQRGDTVRDASGKIVAFEPKPGAGKEFQCQNPKCEMFKKIWNADFNASVNIAKRFAATL